jgi:hypothetical protein
MPDMTGHCMQIQVHDDGQSEYVEIRNHSQITQPLRDWVLASLKCNQFYALPPITLNPGATIRVHSGPDAIDDPPNDWLWTTDNVWRNNCHVAILFDSEGREVARHAHRSGHRPKPSLHRQVLMRENDKFVIVNEAQRIGNKPRRWPWARA